MHNNITAAGSRDRPPMLAPGRYPQWRSRFLRYLNEAIHLILTGIGDDIYSTVDAFQTAQEMWEAIERLQQGESLNIQDVKTNLFWEFRKFTSHNGESMESYYTRFYKLMNEIIRNNLTVTTMQVNVQFFQQLQPEWSRFVMIVKKQHKLDEVSYHELFDILKQYQNEVNKLRAEKLARNANPLALVTTAQASQDLFYQTPRSHRSSAPSPKPTIPSRSQMTTRHKGKKIAKPITPLSETASEEDNDPEQAQRDKDMQKNLALIAKYFKKIYKPTNNKFRTSSNSKNKNVDMTTLEKVGSQVVQKTGIQCFNCKEYGHFAKECRKPKRYDWLTDMDEEVDEQELEAHYSYMAKIHEVPTADSGTDSEPVQNDAEYNVFANVLQHSEQSESVSNTCLVETDDSNVISDSPDMCEDDIQNDQNDVESDDERVALANLIANLKLDTKQAEFEKFKAFNDCTIDYDKFEHKLNEALGQLARKDTVIREGLKTKAYELSVVKEKHDELMKQSLLTKSYYEDDQNSHANRLIPDGEETLALETESRSKLNKDPGDSLKFVHELKQEMHADLKYVESLEKAIDELEYEKAEFSDMYDVILHECVSKDVMCSYLQPLSDLDELAELQLEKHSISLEIALQNCKEQVKNDTVCNEKASNGFRKEREQYIEIQDLKDKLQDKNIAISELKKLIEQGKGKSVDTKFDRPSVVRQPNAHLILKPSVLEGLSKPVTAQTLPQTAKKAK
nr:hypothetical protein [Tanacetum cinerariifolium]